ncbi:DUF397 domain-containing protein [Streptomyces caatingaensis]|uniref:DUF397 domain-containing protein n=1 Tax=Streptomyces caatingaensis TaxID=1678637 RepID=UPI00099D5DCA|nr:DUF397 domain-containing protein [Streptomyces caatingaensis]
MSTNDRRPAREADLSGVCWRKSSYSSGNGACVEVAATDGVIAVRDSKEPSGPVLQFNRAQWASFVNGAAREATTGS